MVGSMISGCTFLNKQLHNDDSNSNSVSKWWESTFCLKYAIVDVHFFSVGCADITIIIIHMFNVLALFSQSSVKITLI